jgi:2-polyprenyl-3-methyl-5-hydroxy-6-metoxy-1,4-benzoquinol methylase
MNFDPKLNWKIAIKSTLQKNDFAAQGLIRIIRGKYPNLTPVLKSLKVLDVGCGDGRNSDFLDKEGFKVTGLEIEQTVVDLLKKSIKILILL